MRRPIRITQRENAEGDFWYTVRAGNGENTTTSKMYPERWRATRAARALIAAIAPAPVVFEYLSGPTVAAVVAGRDRGVVRFHRERIR